MGDFGMLVGSRLNTLYTENNEFCCHLTSLKTPVHLVDDVVTENNSFSVLFSPSFNLQEVHHPRSMAT